MFGQSSRPMRYNGWSLLLAQWRANSTVFMTDYYDAVTKWSIYLWQIQKLNVMCRCLLQLTFIISTLFFQRKSAWCAIPCVSLCVSGFYPSLVNTSRLVRSRVNSFPPLPNWGYWGCISMAMVVLV